MNSARVVLSIEPLLYRITELMQTVTHQPNLWEGFSKLRQLSAIRNPIFRLGFPLSS
jgi:hypothetical protein